MKDVRGKVGLTNFGNMLCSVFLYDVIVVIVNVVVFMQIILSVQDKEKLKHLFKIRGKQRLSVSHCMSYLTGYTQQGDILE